MPLPFEDEGSEPVPGDDSTDPASDDGIVRPAQVTRKFPHDCDISVQPRNPSNTKPLTHNVTAGEKNDTNSPPPDAQSSDSSQGPEEDFNLSSHSSAEDHSSSALCLPMLTPDEFSAPQQGASQLHEEEEEEEQQVHSMFQSSEHPHFPHCLPEQSEIVCNPPPSQPSDVHIVPANYSCGHSCNREALSLPTVQCNGTARHLCVYNPPPSRPSQSSHVYMSKPVQPEDRTAMDRNKASKHVLVCGQPSESKASCSSSHQGMLVCGKETRERNYEQKCELFSTTLSSATTHMPLPCPLPQDLPTANAMSKSVDVDEAECVTSEDNSSQDAKRCPAAEPSAAVLPDTMQNHAISESDDSLEANEDQVDPPPPPVCRKNKRRRGRKK